MEKYKCSTKSNQWDTVEIRRYIHIGCLLTLCQLERVLSHLHIMYEQYFSVVDLFTLKMMAIFARKKETFVNQYFNLHIFVNEMKL